jgi:CheY-like chemotaxis protein
LGDQRDGIGVLVVEDDLDIRLTLTEVLAEAGFRACEAANGEEALRLLHDGARPDVILLDLMMPVMNGWQFRSEQLREPELAAIPVVVCSASRHARRDAEQLQARAFIPKPVDIDRLVEVVREAVD